MPAKADRRMIIIKQNDWFLLRFSAGVSLFDPRRGGMAGSLGAGSSGMYSCPSSLKGFHRDA